LEESRVTSSMWSKLGGWEMSILTIGNSANSTSFQAEGYWYTYS